MSDTFNPTPANIAEAKKCEHAIFLREDHQDPDIPTWMYTKEVATADITPETVITDIKCGINQQARDCHRLCVYGVAQPVDCPLGKERVG